MEPAPPGVSAAQSPARQDHRDRIATMTALLTQPGTQRDAAAAATPPAAPAPDPARIHGLDGLRAVAVAAVLVFHLGRGWLPGGFLGVDLFFVISGFLITTLLLAELERSGRIAFGAFYLRRARRLLPALLLTLAGSLVLAATVARDVALQTAADVPAALLYVSNWWAISQEQSYFELVGRGNLLGHLWSLALEEQFYLLWPLLLGLIGLAAAGRTRIWVLGAAGAGALLSTVWMTVLAVRHGMPVPTDPTRVYFGTDTHAMSVLAGAALAAVWNVRRFRADLVPGARMVLLGAGASGLAVAGLLFAGASEWSGWLYRGGFLLVALVFALVLAAATHPASPLGPALDNPVLRWIGVRSYGIYLFHWPVFLVTRPGQDVPFAGLWWDAARVALVLALAEASYRWVETPIRRGRMPRPSARAGMLFVVASGVVVLLIASAPRPEETAAALRAGAQAGAAFDTGSDRAEVGGAGAAAPAAGAERTGLDWYGDSVALWSAQQLQATFPGVRLDAVENRAPTNIFAAVQQDDPQHDVVLHLGNAGPVAEQELRTTLDGLADNPRVVLVNSNADFTWSAQAGEVIAEVAVDYPNVRLVDWRAAAQGRTEWFVDGLHLTDAGRTALFTAVQEALDRP
jgi:peptidoglycan/LPS O-acetylase OafA/YrhL